MKVNKNTTPPSLHYTFINGIAMLCLPRILMGVEHARDILGRNHIYEPNMHAVVLLYVRLPKKEHHMQVYIKLNHFHLIPMRWIRNKTNKNMHTTIEYTYEEQPC